MICFCLCCCCNERKRRTETRRRWQRLFIGKLGSALRAGSESAKERNREQAARERKHIPASLATEPVCVCVSLPAATACCSCFDVAADSMRCGQSQRRALKPVFPRLCMFYVLRSAYTCTNRQRRRCNKNSNNNNSAAGKCRYVCFSVQTPS